MGCAHRDERCFLAPQGNILRAQQLHHARAALLVNILATGQQAVHRAVQDILVALLLHRFALLVSLETINQQAEVQVV